MGFTEEITATFLNGNKKYLRHISIDCVIFGFHENELKVLLLNAKYAKQWALPGGFVKKQEHLNSAANRILNNRTGLDNIFLNQFHVFSEPNRSTKKINVQFLKNAGVTIKDCWLFERFISIGYWALVDFTKAIPVADVFSDACQWCNISDVPKLILDHNKILEKALQNLRLQLSYQPIGYNLLPKKFTLPQLQKLYETILDKKLDRRNFQRKISDMKILIKLNEIKKGVAHKAPNLYKFDLRKYNNVLKLKGRFEL